MGVYLAFGITISILVVHGTSIGSDSLMQCSKYHFEENVLEKLNRLEFKIENHENTIAKWIENVGVGLDEIENLKQVTKSFMNVQKNEFDDEKVNLNKSLYDIEMAAENLNNKTENCIDSYDELIETKLQKVTDSETNRNSAFALLRSELRSSFDSTANSLNQNISTVWKKQTSLQKDFDGMKNKRKKPNIAFTAYLKNSYTKHEIVKFEHVWTNEGNAYNPTTGVFTAPIPGLYSFTAVLLSENVQSLYRHIWHNNDSLAGTYVTDKGFKTGTFTVNLKLKKGDEVYIKSKDTIYGAVYSSIGKYSTFSGIFIG